MKYLIIALLLFVSTALMAQEQEQKKKLVQLTGVVVSGNDLEPVPFTSVLIKGSNRGTVCDYYGFFSLVVAAMDTVQFSSVGYGQAYYTIPDTLTGSRYSVIQMLEKDTIVLQEQVVYPWPSKEQFKQAFLSLNVSKDDYDRAFENMTREDVRLAIQGVPLSAQGNYSHVVQREYTRLYNLGQLPTTSLMNPLAWAQFIEAWKSGDFKKNK